MTTKNIQTILFAGLIAAMILPFSMVDSAEAAKQYTRAEIDHAFTAADGYVTYVENNIMKVDRDSMIADGVPYKDMKIMTKYAREHNKLMNALASGVESDIVTARENVLNGSFKNLFDAPTGDFELATDVDYWSLNACGVTSGNSSTWPSNPQIILGVSGYSSQSSIESALSSQDLHKVNWPYSDWGDVVYAEKNFTGKGGCNEGEFRDEHHVYDDTVTHTYNGVSSSGYHELIQYNEPNPEVFDYDNPTYWWAVFVQQWHNAN